MKTISFKLLFIMILSIQSSYIFGQSCDCENELNWVITTFKDNDAGFQYVIDKKGENDYNRFTEKIIEKSRQNNDIRSCKKVIDEWLRYFRKGHLFVGTFGDNDWQSLSYFMPSGYKPVKLMEEKPKAKPDTISVSAKDDPYIKQLNDKTLYLYIPSFEIEYKAKIDSVLIANDLAIKETPNLIIDIRNSNGGSDFSFNKIIPYIYTNPIRSIGEQLKATPLNKNGYQNYIKMLEANNEREQIPMVQKIIEQIDQNMGNFFTPEGSEQLAIDSSYTKLPYPQKVGILCDKYNGSTDEEFLLMAKQSSKVKLFGRTTYGSLDISNMNFAFSPSGVFLLGYGMTKSYRIPDFCIDGIGLQPDYYIDNTITDWVKFTQDVLEQ